MIYLEDLAVGRVFLTDSFEISRDEIVRFATQFDPHPFHLEGAPLEPFGGLVASGWHTAARVHRAVLDHFSGELASGGSDGVDELRWRAPVRPGDVLIARVEVVRTEPSSRADRGRVVFAYDVRCESRTVMTALARAFILRRPELVPAAPKT